MPVGKFGMGIKAVFSRLLAYVQYHLTMACPEPGLSAR